MGCVRWYLQGQRVGDAPVFDGLRARCGQLLYGHVNRATATTGNKHLGLPCNLKGQLCGARSQPPFLLRWPPQELSQFLPMSSHRMNRQIVSRFEITTVRSRHGRPGRTTDAWT